MKRTRTNAQAVSRLMRERIQSGEWMPGQLIPGRRALATEYQAALTTVERSAATLIAEGLLRVDGRRCTYVAEGAAQRTQNEHAGSRHSLDISLADRIHGTIGLVTALIHYQSELLRRELWTARMLSACEHVLAGHPDLSQTFVNLTPGARPDLTTEEAVEPLIRARVDAAVVIGEGEPHLQIVERLARAGIHVVSACPSSSQGVFPEVCADDCASGLLAAQHLMDRGCERLVYLQPFDARWVQMRLIGVREGCEGRDLRCFPAVIPSDVSNDPDDQTRSAMATSMAFLSEGMQPGTGIIAPNDAIAAAFIRVAAHADLQAGRDFAIIGFDDRERALGLTSMRPQLEAIGEEAGRLALRLLSGEACPPRVVIPNRLIPRISTRSPLSESDAESVGVTSQGAL